MGKSVRQCSNHFKYQLAVRANQWKSALRTQEY